ncbi:MAG TPA: hypothetical protein VMY37_40270 [Thermoguttaceae bacterium]|nr:hypothetical protein [Thermoguttaceae bacterium]
MFPPKTVLLTVVLVLISAIQVVAQPQGEIDWNRARELRQRSIRGEKLTEDEQSYLQRAVELRQKQRPQQRRPVEIKPPVGLIPLTDMTGDDRYKGQDGGLYGDGKNEPPQEHLEAALHHAKMIRPFDAEGEPSHDGKLVMISVGMSNTTQEFSAFVRLANADPAKSPNVVIVEGAQGGMEASDWAYPEKRFRQERPSPWDVLDRRFQQAKVSRQQVQVVWIKQARRNPASLGEFPKHAEEMKGDLVIVLQKLKERFPNLRIAYLSSRIYAGYAKTPLNPEPYAYESAFVVRWLIQDQIKGEPSLNYDSDKGTVKSPLLLWGPYLWADGENGRKIDDLVWKSEDLAGDGTHPSDSGRQKVAELLLGFMKNDPTANVWFAK